MAGLPGAGKGGQRRRPGTEPLAHLHDRGETLGMDILKNTFGRVVPQGTETEFASPERSSSVELKRLVEEAQSSVVLAVTLNAVGGLVAVLNEHRQILALSKELRDALGAQNDSCVAGLRPGEAVNCAHFPGSPSGCGTGHHCRGCGAVLTILKSQETGKPADGECCLTLERNGKRQSSVFRVRAMPVRLSAETSVTVLVLHDISALKNFAALERMLWTETADSISGIRAFGELLARGDQDEVAQRIVDLADQVNSEIAQYRLMLQAEQGTLDVQPTASHAKEVLAILRARSDRDVTVVGHAVSYECLADDDQIHTDVELLVRILVHMVQNAVEASGKDGSVRVWFEWYGSRPAFYVHNEGCIDQETCLHIFDRSFSTKSTTGRGVGTYLMRILGEDWLGGTVSFTTSEKEGTCFFIHLPPVAEMDRKGGDRSPAAAGEEVAMVAEGLARLPHGLLEQMVEATISLDADRLADLIGRSSEHDVWLAGALRALADRYDYDALERLLRSAAAEAGNR